MASMIFEEKLTGWVNRIGPSIVVKGGRVILFPSPVIKNVDTCATATSKKVLDFQVLGHFGNLVNGVNGSEHGGFSGF